MMAAKMKSESIRIADQLRRAFQGEAWHGPSVLEVLEGVDAATAAARPVADSHSIWEIVLHIAVWDGAALERIKGKVVQPSGEQDWPPAKDTSAAAWKNTLQHLKKTHADLVKAVEKFPETRLSNRVPGKEPDFYSFYYMLHGIAQHELYHAGQIALLKKAARSR
jgi:uncharacterized damage-inducible protein DinB